LPTAVTSRSWLAGLAIFNLGKVSGVVELNHNTPEDIVALLEYCYNDDSPSPEVPERFAGLYACGLYARLYTA
jgi:hypothetical protein